MLGAANSAAATYSRCVVGSSVIVLERFGVVSPLGGPTSSGMLTLHCPPGEVYALASFLREKGARAVSVADIDYVFSLDNPLYAKLESGLAPSA